MSEPVEKQGGKTNSFLTDPATPGAARGSETTNAGPAATASSIPAGAAIGNAVVRPLALASCGMEFVAAVGIFSFAGLWLDRRLGLLPLFTLLGFGLGLSLGFLALYKTIHRLMAAEARDEATRPPKTGKAPMKGSALLDSPEDQETRPEVARSPLVTGEHEPRRSRPFLDRPEEP